MNQPAPLFKRVESQVNLPQLEEGILKLWTQLDAFQQSNARRKGANGKGEFVFYDGPPFATGTPHYGHLLAGTIKDIVPRFWNMRGFHVDRRFGWDCHGLPIENLAQKALGLNGTPEIRTLGVDKFNEQCRSMVQTYVAEWRRTVTRMGRWVDFDNDYKTMDRDFMESVWWVFKRLWEQKSADGKPRVYKAHRIMPYSWKLTTPLSNFEAGNNYKDVQDPAITVRFELKEDGFNGNNPVGGIFHAARTLGSKVYALAWTTTPWTLPENLALCLGPDVLYAFVEDLENHQIYLLAHDRLSSYYKKPEQYEILTGGLTGAVLAGLKYVPLFPYFADQPNSFRLLTDSFVSTGDGTGIVHMAPAYGEDDYRVCRAAGIDLVDPLDEEAKFTAQIPEYAGQFCKDADKAIIKRLKDEGKLVHQSTLVHSYPFCERTDTPLIYRAIEAWYVRVEDLRDQLAANNAKIRWVPEAVGSNRFGNWLKDARDWNISRNRFWGSCLPIWVNVADATDTLCVGSVAELEKLSGQTITDLHKHHLDKVLIEKDGKTYQRTPEVLDCWFESGAMPYAQVHWMGGADGKQAPPVFPAQFIAEGLDQTRGWFYTLLVLSTALFDKPAFQNVVVNGLVLAEDGQKMSKSKKNYPDPHLVLDTYGADALRAYLIDSPVVRAEPLKFSEAGLKEIVRTVVLPYWNALSFFTTYAAVDGFDPRTVTARPPRERKPIDRWALSVLQSLVRDVNAEMEGYRLYNVVPRLVSFIDQLTNTYIRLNRARFWKSPDPLDQADAYHTLYQVLTTFAKVLAPFMPFLTEEVYQRLVRPTDAAAPASVHWCDYPQADEALIDRDLERDVALSLTVTSLARKLREDHKLKIRQPLPALTIISRDPVVRAAGERFRAAIALELNVKEVRFSADEAAFCALTVKPNLKVLGKRCGPKLKGISATLSGWSFAEVTELEAGRTITVDGETISKDDLMLTRSPVAGAITASLGAVTVALDTAVTPDLMREGLAREFVSVVQQARKDAGLEVSDRIRVLFASDDTDIVAALTDHAAFIADEVLAVEFRHDASAATTADLNSRPVRYTLTKA
ncbi:MAG: isoleucine--tRNA ligase [Planctomycetes bacterium]|nr:isoleucine--tRNA ligase [Planctomycetota bacterium]